MSDVGRGPRKGAFLLAAVNDLTLINETYGYDVGDEVIAIVGRRIGRVLRRQRLSRQVFIQQVGIILPDCDVKGADAIGRRLMASVRDSVVDTSVGAVAATISVGALLLPDHATGAQAAIGRALQTLDGARSDRNDPFASIALASAASRNAAAPSPSPLRSCAP
ncbi:MAG: GGDEF domain-containing protein [Methyloceanibacter sp.]|uniref:GGDEF domain-containing protein n=1 Tax=Methyloceanibacter sp. TaxID=1965321 RepID=UPI003D9B535B